MDFTHLVSGLEFLLTYTIVLISTLLITVVFSPFYLLAAIPYAYGQLRQALFGGPPNRLAFPGRPTAAWPRYFPLAGNPKVSCSYYLAIMAQQLLLVPSKVRKSSWHACRHND
jgi:hypothetical protein